MEALTAVSVAALTVYDMCKAIDRGMRIDDIRLVHKTGGKSGTYEAGASMIPVEEARGRILAAFAAARRAGRRSTAAWAACWRHRSWPAATSRPPPSPPWTATRCAPPTRRRRPATGWP